MTPTLVATRLGDRAADGAARPLLVVGPSLGTSVRALWTGAARLLCDRFDVVGIDLPGHGRSPAAAGGIDMADLARGILAAAGAVQADPGDAGAPFHYAGVSAGGCIGLQLLVDAPDRIGRAVILNSAARIGEPQGWVDRAALVAEQGVGALRQASAERWFAPGFADRDPATAAALLDSLCAADGAGYRQVCGALARFDLRDRLGGIARPVLAIGGQDDVATPPGLQHDIARGVRDGRAEILPQVGHLAPAEAPRDVARLIGAFLG
ncbi:alpha/beta fold hydrolase [Paracoccus luteus]|uniref:alpha/beta fold hydrolase n=1 Tax=Paracoccus luteus TaxID=2508543 RepID=UPI00106F0E18|nr:alpha/beta hydrolase [Paracoccus luteus]